MAVSFCFDCEVTWTDGCGCKCPPPHNGHWTTVKPETMAWWERVIASLMSLWRP